MVELQPVDFTLAQEFVKRTFDVAASAIALVLLSPLLAVVAAAIRLTSEGPALYRSTRVGRGGRYFQFLKFRSMYVNRARREDLTAHNEKGGHLFKMRRDPRITPVGRFIRRWSIDELPQLINVLRGDMSMVGPRPLPASDLDPDGQSRAFEAWAEQRSRVLPGITGLWQIRGRSELPFDKMVDLDVEYIRNWSLTLDFQILLETPLVLVTGRGAY
jgi:lipopolysaccharide/colanic/teichoic acid biosynthesis glycosyltransferase